jgi:hypothetical protein
MFVRKLDWSVLPISNQFSPRVDVVAGVDEAGLAFPGSVRLIESWLTTHTLLSYTRASQMQVGAHDPTVQGAKARSFHVII